MPDAVAGPLPMTIAPGLGTIAPGVGWAVVVVQGTCRGTLRARSLPNLTLNSIQYLPRRGISAPAHGERGLLHAFIPPSH